MWEKTCYHVWRIPFNKLISLLDIAEKSISVIEDESIQIMQTNAQTENLSSRKLSELQVEWLQRKTHPGKMW